MTDHPSMPHVKAQEKADPFEGKLPICRDLLTVGKIIRGSTPPHLAELVEKAYDGLTTMEHIWSPEISSFLFIRPGIFILEDGSLSEMATWAKSHTQLSQSLFVELASLPNMGRRRANHLHNSLRFEYGMQWCKNLNEIIYHPDAFKARFPNLANRDGKITRVGGGAYTKASLQSIRVWAKNWYRLPDITADEWTWYH